jgi:hypothetical protein
MLWKPASGEVIMKRAALLLPILGLVLSVQAFGQHKPSPTPKPISQLLARQAYFWSGEIQDIESMPYDGLDDTVAKARLKEIAREIDEADEFQGPTAGDGILISYLGAAAIAAGFHRSHLLEIRTMRVDLSERHNLINAHGGKQPDGDDPQPPLLKVDALPILFEVNKAVSRRAVQPTTMNYDDLMARLDEINAEQEAVHKYLDLAFKRVQSM